MSTLLDKKKQQNKRIHAVLNSISALCEDVGLRILSCDVTQLFAMIIGEFRVSTSYPTQQMTSFP